MSDATVVAAEIQDLALSVDGVAAAIRGAPEPVVNVHMPESAPAAVTVNVPQQAAPDVHVAAPNVQVNVPQQAAPEVHVSAPNVQVHSEVNVPPVKPNAYDVRITERDEYGFIVSFTIVPH